MSGDKGMTVGNPVKADDTGHVRRLNYALGGR